MLARRVFFFHSPRRFCGSTTSRFVVSQTSSLTQEFDRKHGIATLRMHRGRSNALSLEFLQELRSCLDLMHSDDRYRGVVFTSSLKHFCTGFDVSEFISPPDPQRLASFWREAKNLIETLYTSHLVTASAINGVCCAAGVALIAACDFNTCVFNSAPGFHIKAVHAGLLPPSWFVSLLNDTMGAGRAYQHVMTAKPLNINQALECNLIHQTVDHKHRLEDFTKAAMIESFLGSPDFSRRALKSLIRRPIAKAMAEANANEKEIEELTKHILKPEVQAVLQTFREGIKSK